MIPPAILAAYPPEVRDCSWSPLPSGGGLSGGRVWKGDLLETPRYAIKRWPAEVTPDRMSEIHERVRAVAACDFAQRLIPTTSGTTLTSLSGYCWDVSEWADGTPDLLDRASHPLLVAAGRTLAALHSLWLPQKQDDAPCSAVTRRLNLFAEWERTRFHFTDPQHTELLPTLELVRSRLPRARTELMRFAPVRGRVVGIHGDFWPENILFRDDRLSAVLDFGNVGFDHPAVDLGRLFADVPGADRPLIAAAVEAYNALAPFDLSVSVVEVLASSGRLGSLANWHLRLNAGSPDAGLLTAALPRIRRLAALVAAG